MIGDKNDCTGKYGSPRLQYLQELVALFQNASDEETKEKIVANLGNFAYDPYNYTFLRQLNILELFRDFLTEPNERLVEFAVGGICNACAGKLFSWVTLLSLCNPTIENEILKPEVLDAIRRFTAAGALNPGFGNLARAFLDRHVSKLG